MLGLTKIQVRANRKLYGENIIDPINPISWFSVGNDTEEAKRRSKDII